MQKHYVRYKKLYGLWILMIILALIYALLKVDTY